MKRSIVPLREFIQDRLYHPTLGYFCRKGYDDYQRELIEKYPKNAWLTPCEIFKPYYGMTIANYIKSAHSVYQENHNKHFRHKIRIVEAGAGTGSAAESILYFFKNFDSKVYENIQYTIVEISPTLCKRIEEKLKMSFPHLFERKQIRIINEDITTFKSKELIFMLFFEVLDNMPHDKVLFNPHKGQYTDYVTVDIDTMEESKQLISEDNLIKECLDLYLKTEQQRKSTEAIEHKNKSFIDKIAEKIVNKMYQEKHLYKDLFLPTYFYKYLKTASKNTPNAHFVISDFDKLYSKVPGIGAPIVSNKLEKSHEKQDFKSYLVERGSSDIFFPVNFSLLSEMHKSIFNMPNKSLKTYEFIEEFSDPKWALTKSNFNPIKEDFANTKFFVTDIPKK